MRMRIRFTGLVVLVALGLGTAAAGSLTKAERQKLHPVLQSLIDRQLQGGLAKASVMHHPAIVEESDGSVAADVIIYTDDPATLRAAGVSVNSSLPGFVTARVKVGDLERVAQLAQVSYIDVGAVNRPALDLSVPETGADLLHAGYFNGTSYKGNGVIVLIYDTGIDWRHLDFRNPSDTTKSRILAIWDQTDTQGGGSAPSGFAYGKEWTQTQIEDEFDGSPANVVREKDNDGHGTHVAGTAAGNGFSGSKKFIGMAPEADIIAVKGGEGSFSEARMIDGLTYAANKASQFGKPIVVNWSIGGQQGPHDGTRGYEVAVDNFVTTPGHVVVISAGNDGASPIHFSGSVAVSGTTSVSINVPAYTPTAGTNNDQFILDIWLKASTATVTATITSPTGITYSAGAGGSAPDVSDGTIELYNYIPSGVDVDRNIQLWVHDATASVPKTGTWTLTLSNPATSIDFDGWLSSRSVGSALVTVAGANTTSTVAMPGTANHGITVGSYVTKWAWPSADGNNYAYTGTDRTADISTFSSLGPTRDGRIKPDISAPGQGIMATLSADADTAYQTSRVFPDRKHWLLQGTSMAAPHVTGAVALLLQADPSLTANQIKTLFTSTANTDSYTGSIPNNTWGYGKLDVLEAMVKQVDNGSSQQVTVGYDVPGSNQTVNLTGSTKYAVHFSPSISGTLTGVRLNLTINSLNPIVGSGPLVCEVYTNTTGSVAGIPGTKIGSSVNHPFSQLTTGTYNYIDMTGAGVDVVAGQEYQLVFSVANGGDALIIRTDDGSSPTSRSSIWTGSQWANFGDGASGLPNVNLRARAVVTSISVPVSVAGREPVPYSFTLDQNFPNPFNPSTTIRYAIPTTSTVTLRIFDLLGRQVRSLVNESQAPGRYEVVWNGKDDLGQQVTSGTYFCRLESGDLTMTQKMLLLK